MTYTIKHDEWDYDGMYPRYIDDAAGIMVELSVDRDKTVNLLGSSTSIIDDENIYYYDLASNSFANRAWNNVFGDITDVFNSDGDVIIDIDIPNWFIEHAEKLLELDDKYQDIFIHTFENYDGDCTMDDIRQAIHDYMLYNNYIANDNEVDNVLYVAENASMMWYDSAQKQYVISI